MNKSELLSIYTAEQLAEMVVKLNNAMDSLKYSDSFLKSGLFDNPAVATCEAKINILQNKINNLEEENGRLQSKLDTYNNYLLPRCTKEAKEMIDHNHFTGVRIVTWEQWNNRGEKSMNISDIQKCQDEYEKLLKESPLEGSMNKTTKDIIEQKNNAMAMGFIRIICDLLERYGVYVHCTETKFGENITANSIEEQYGIVFDSMDFSEHDKEFADEIEELKQHISDLECDLKTAGEKIQDLASVNMNLQCERNDYKSKAETLEIESRRIDTNKSELERAKNTINNIDYIMEKLFGLRHDTVGKPDEFEKILSERLKGNVTDFLPTEPIKVADMLINASKKRTNCMTEKEYDKYIFEKWQLRQIAEHLLVYCNHNEEVEE